MRSEEREEVTEILARSLLPDPGWTLLCPDDEIRYTVLRLLCYESITMSQASGGETWVACLDGSIAGAVVWNSPDNPSIPASVYIKGLFRSIPEVVRHPRIAVRCVRNLLALDSIKPKEELCYVVFLGCSIQGRGVGGALMRRLIHSTPGKLYLETQNPDNVGFYEYLGFSSHQTIEETYPGGPSNFGMIYGETRQQAPIEFSDYLKPPVRRN